LSHTVEYSQLAIPIGYIHELYWPAISVGYTYQYHPLATLSSYTRRPYWRGVEWEVSDSGGWSGKSTGVGSWRSPVPGRTIRIGSLAWAERTFRRSQT